MINERQPQQNKQSVQPQSQPQPQKERKRLHLRESIKEKELKDFPVS